MTSAMSRGVSSAEGAARNQRTTRTVLPGRRAPPPLSEACRPWASGKVWLITGRSLPAAAISASLASSLALGPIESDDRVLSDLHGMAAAMWASSSLPLITARPRTRELSL